jgi:hypothetical protein
MVYYTLNTAQRRKFRFAGDKVGYLTYPGLSVACRRREFGMRIGVWAFVFRVMGGGARLVTAGAV